METHWLPFNGDRGKGFAVNGDARLEKILARVCF